MAEIADCRQNSVTDRYGLGLSDACLSRRPNMKTPLRGRRLTGLQGGNRGDDAGAR
jgi:hypothetical protein